MSQYQDLPRVSEKDIETKLELAKGEDLCLLLLAMSELENWRWVQEKYLTYLTHEDKWVASAAITGLGHLARLSGNLDKDKVISSLKKLESERPELIGKIEDSISDIEVFL